MLDEPIEPPEETSPEALLASYETTLADVVADVGADAVVESTGLDEATVSAVEAGDAADLALEDVASILALRDGSPDARAILLEARDHLLLSMSTAIVTVDHLAADVEGDLDAKEIQAKVEGRHPMTLAEYARLNHYLSGRT